MRLWIFIVALTLAAPALADGEWALDCTDDPAVNAIVTEIGASSGMNRVACHNFQTEGTGDSSALITHAESTLWCLNPANDSDGAATAQVWIRTCFGGALVGASVTNDFNCGRILDAALTGATGAPATQNACVRTGPGKYYVEVTAAGLAGENPYVSAEAE
jgi:hypothetical protein